MSNGKTYWGILCRTCLEPVAFDIQPYHSPGLGIANLQPGAICCVHGHDHIYFPHDFRSLSSAVAIADATMQGNREAYRSINPPRERSFEAPAPSMAKAKNLGFAKEMAFGVAKEMAKGRTAQPSSLFPDPRREAARIAANSRWADWAMKKTL